MVLEKIYGTERTERQLREGIWITKLATVRPGGCNEMDSSISVTFWHDEIKVRADGATSWRDIMMSCDNHGDIMS